MSQKNMTSQSFSGGVAARAVELASRQAGSGRLGELAIAVVLVAMPLTYVDFQFGGFLLSGWAWLGSFVAALAVVVVTPLKPRAVRHLAPYLLFLVVGLVSLLRTPVLFDGLLTLGQLTAPALAYLVAFGTPLSEKLRTRSLRLVVFAYIGAGAASLLFGLDEGWAGIGHSALAESVSVSARPLAINLVAMFLLVNALSRSRMAVVAAGAAGLIFALGTGSRIAAAVLLLLIWASPRVIRSWRGRVATLLVSVGLLPLVLSLPAVQNRFFFEQGGTVQDLLGMSANVDTAGRRELWPRLIDYCEDEALTGYGLGASYSLSRAAFEDVPCPPACYGGVAIEHPHNEYIKTFCDTGLVGTVLAWWFVVAVGIRSLRRLRSQGSEVMAVTALLAAVAFLLLAVTDNVLAYPAQFTLPVFVLFAWAAQSADVDARSAPDRSAD